jgi:Zn finger protein HypA/HybF involved in hydrogenase expression|tara:strand:- start:3794 stop:4000 length:207 start_codon:yes stop_codon:yes gene_type:complete
MVIYVDPKKIPVKKIKCKDCKKEFEQKTNARYARKYCKKCSKKRKKDYADLWKVSADECEDAGGGWGK